MPRYPVIGIAGKARSGKDTLAQILLQLGVARYRYSFAGPIRAMLKAGLGIDMDDPDWANRKERSVAHLGVTPRRLMQTLGTEWGRETIHRDIWVKEAQLHFMENGAGMVVTDVRFENEAEWIRLIGGLVVHIERSSAPPVEAHASEGGVTVSSGDAIVFNHGSRDELRAQVAELFIRTDEVQQATIRG